MFDEMQNFVSLVNDIYCFLSLENLGGNELQQWFVILK